MGLCNTPGMSKPESSMSDPTSENLRHFVVRVNLDPRDIHAARTLEDALKKSGAGPRDILETAVVSAPDAQSACKVTVERWVRIDAIPPVMTTRGPISGECGHRHGSYEAAYRCLCRCRALYGVIDRHVVNLDG